MMKIGVVRLNLAKIGGAERYAHGLIEELVSCGHEVHVFTNSLPENYPVQIKSHLFSGEMRLFREWLQRKTEQVQLDTLFTMERIWPSDIFRAGDGVHRRWFELCRDNARGFNKWWLSRRPFHRDTLQAEKHLFVPENTGLVLCNSAMVGEEVTRYYDYPQERIRVIPNGTNFDKFYPVDSMQREKVRAQLGANAHETVALFLGSGFWRKGLDRAIELVAEWQRQQPSRRLRFYVVGKGKTATYQRQARSLGIEGKVLFIGEQPPDRVLQWYQSADVFLFPTRYDPFANVCLEANACGVPVVTTPTNGFCEQITDGVNGAIWQENWTVAQAAEAAEKLLQKGNSADAVRGAVRHLTTESHTTALLQLLESISN